METLSAKGTDDVELVHLMVKELEGHTPQLMLEIRALLCQRPDSNFSSASVVVFADEHGSGRVEIGMYLSGRNIRTRSLEFAGHVRLPEWDPASYGEEESFIIGRIADAGLPRENRTKTF